MKNILLKVAYDGSDFFGWQKTKMGLSIEEALELVLKQILNDAELKLQAASRTDRGVHADGQAVNFIAKKEISLSNLLKSLNSLLPKNISVIDAYEVPLDFHPTLNAIKKTYHYYICHGPTQHPKYRFYSWHVSYFLDLKLIEKACAFFIGEHDFSSFCNYRKNLTYKDKRREIFKIEVEPLENMRFRFIVVGNHFLYKMVRNLVGTLIYIGSGKIALEDLPKIMESKKRSASGLTAPAHGLFLHNIEYDFIQNKNHP